MTKESSWEHYEYTKFWVIIFPLHLVSLFYVHVLHALGLFREMLAFINECILHDLWIYIFKISVNIWQIDFQKKMKNNILGIQVLIV